MRRVKIKVRREPHQDETRVHDAWAAIGDAELLVDANGTWTRKQALGWAEELVPSVTPHAAAASLGSWSSRPPVRRAQR